MGAITGPVHLEVVGPPWSMLVDDAIQNRNVRSRHIATSQQDREGHGASGIAVGTRAYYVVYLWKLCSVGSFLSMCTTAVLRLQGCSGGGPLSMGGGTR